MLSVDIAGTLAVAVCHMMYSFAQLSTRLPRVVLKSGEVVLKLHHLDGSAV